MQSSLDKVKQHFPSHAQHHLSNPVVKGAKKHPMNSSINIPDHHFNIVQHKQMISQSATTSIGADSLNGGNVEFKIQSKVDKLDLAFLKISVTNDTGAGATLAPVAFLIDRIELFSENGSNLISTTYGQQLWLANALYSEYEWEYLKAFMGSTSAWVTTGTVLANGASQDFYVPITSVLSPGNLVLAGLRSDLSIRVFFNTTSLTHLAGSLVNCDNVVLLLRGNAIPQQEKQQWIDLYNKGNYLIPYVNWQGPCRQTFTLAASTSYSMNLSSVKGIIAGFFITMRDAVVTGANQGTYLAQFDQYDIQESDGRSMLGHYKREINERYLDYLEHFSNTFGLTSNFLFIPFCEDICSDVQHGTNTGSHVFNGFEKFTWTTLSTLVGGSYQIDVYPLSREHLLITKGTLASSRS